MAFWHKIDIRHSIELLRKFCEKITTPGKKFHDKFHLWYFLSAFLVFSYGPGASAQRVPEPDPLPGISFDTRPDPIQF